MRGANVLTFIARGTGAIFDLDHPGHYVHWGFIQLSVANLVVICAMVLVFVAALLIPFRRHRDGGS